LTIENINLDTIDLNNDIQAMEEVFKLIKSFIEKIPMKNTHLKLKRLLKKINELKNLPDNNLESKLRIFKDILKKLKKIIQQYVSPEIAFIVGGHGGIVIDNIGYCEFDDPVFAISTLLDIMNLAIVNRIPYNIEIAISCIEWLMETHPNYITKFLELFKTGQFEIINPTYSQPYNLIIGPESNIKQFEYGLRILKKLKIPVKIYHCTETSLHPQIPQILKGFNINYCSLKTRLLGTCPTSPSGCIEWIGLDDTKIITSTDLPGLYNGEYWHGTFYREIPNMLFQALSRPFFKTILFSSIEDFIMPLKYQKEVWRISGFLDIFGKFILSSNFSEILEVNGAFKYSRDMFSLADNIFSVNKLFLLNKNCEIMLITAEILNAIMYYVNDSSNDEFFDGLWKNLLLIQAHDVYAVPFINPGDYSSYQLNDELYKKMNISKEKISISELSIKLAEKLINKSQDFIIECLHKLANKSRIEKNKMDTDTLKFLVFNPTIIPRKDIFSIDIDLNITDLNNLKLIDDNNNEYKFEYSDSTLKFTPKIDPLSYSFYYLTHEDKNKNRKKNKDNIKQHESFFYDIEISEDKKSILIKYNHDFVYELYFEIKEDYILNIKEQTTNTIEKIYLISGRNKHRLFELKIIQYNGINRLEFELKAQKIDGIIIKPKIEISKTFVNYPFGIEETKRSKIQSLDFLFLRGSPYNLIYCQKNSQQFIINLNNKSFINKMNSKCEYFFFISITDNNEISDIYNYITCYYYRLIGIAFYDNYKYKAQKSSFLNLSSTVNLINLWRRKNGIYLRLFNPSSKSQNISINGILTNEYTFLTDLTLSEISELPSNNIKINGFKIMTLKIK